MKKIIIFGASGSVGRSTIELVRANPDQFKIVGASAGSRFQDLEKTAAALSIEHLLDTRGEMTTEAITGFIQQCEPDIILNAVSGFAGLRFTLATLESNLPLALANKESLVAAGDFVMMLSKERKAPIIPVDSEHSAIWQCLANDHAVIKPFRKIFLTCSGGPFFGWEDLQNITPQQALQHPNWDMGQGITIDSATLANKCLEYFEAMHLFGATKDQVEIVIHPQSVVHSMVQFEDSSIIAQMSPPSMQLPIAYALNFPKRSDCGLPTPDFSALDLNFRAPDKTRFRTLQALDHCATHMQNLPTVFNAANEEARNAFIRGEISFNRIFEVLEQVLETTKIEGLDSIEKIYEVDQIARTQARKLVSVK
jgi:1-deoxy-D-xylulose-5-phosphate reductoisomerase